MEIALANNDKIKVNDHVYCASNWAVRDGTPYSIARVMEFLPPESSSTSRLKAKGKDQLTRARIAWYYRPGDISERQMSDSRLLLAAIYTEIIPVSHLRGKCWVRHRDKIPDLLAWRKKPDRFYYQRMFDPFVKKEFEVLPTVEIQNLPRHIRQVLAARYEYVIAEKEIVSDLVDDLRLCNSCDEWCSTPESVQCAGCRNHFHMTCVQPPLQAKPSRGYGWTCAPCSKQREDKIDGVERDSTPKANKNNGAISKKRQKQRKERHSTIVNPEDDNDHYYKMWQFRYFGAYVNIDDAMDANDFIYVRAPPRVGLRYQVTLGAENIGASKDDSKDLPDRGGDDTIEVLSNVNHQSDEWVDSVLENMRQVATKKHFLQNVDWLTEFFARVSNSEPGKELSPHLMKGALRVSRKWTKNPPRYLDREWNDSEVSAFEDALSLHGPELRAVRDEVHTRSIAEVVRYFGIFKSTCLGQENKALRAREANGTLSRKPSPSRHPLVTNDDEDSVIKIGSQRRPPTCAACGSTTSSNWWKAPKGLVTPSLCTFCGVAWRKYGDLTLSRAREREEVTGIPKPRLPVEKREPSPIITIPPTKKPKTTAATIATTQERPERQDRIPVRQLPCLWCRKTAPIGKVLKCSNCALSAHSILCGVPNLENEAAETWLCELCANEKSMEAALDGRCVLCPPPKPDAGKDPTFLRACKPTWSQKWVHVLCSLFFPEVQFCDVDAMKAVEGVQTVAVAKWKSTCSLCNEQGGATVRCADCSKEFHVSCAYRAGYKCGFEIMPVRNVRKEVLPVTVFKRETGIMNIFFWCTAHPLHFKRIYDLCEISADTGETALQVFTRTYKRAHPDNGHPLLRKAEHLEAIINAARREGGGVEIAPPKPPPPKCRSCGTEYSPFFHYNEETEPGLPECHRCCITRGNVTGIKAVGWKVRDTREPLEA